MKIVLNLTAVKQGGQITRAIEFVKNFKKNCHFNDELIILLTDVLVDKIRESNHIKIVKITLLMNSKHWLARMIWENFTQIKLIKLLKADLYLTFSHYLPLFKLNIPSIVLISNIAPFTKLSFQKENFFGKLRLILLKITILNSVKKASYIIAISNYCKKILYHYNICPKKIMVITNGVKKNKIKNFKKLTYLKFKKKYKYILYISHFYRYKNFEQLLLAYSKLPKFVISEYRLKLVGCFYDKKYVSSLMDLAKKLDIDNRVDFIESLQENKLRSMYKGSSLFVFTSVIENSPNILLEAMSFGLPLLVVKTPPMPEFCSRSAMYFKIDDAKDLSNKINSLLASNKILNKMSINSFNRSKNYSWNLFTKNVINLCHKSLVLENSKAS